MDDFKMVLGMNFLQKVKVVSLPFLCLVAILEQEKPCMVSTVTEGSSKTLKLSAMQREPMPKEIEGVLDEFKDVMSPKLPKRLPPRRKEDHKIELEPGAKPSAMGPYRMASQDLEELRRQLKELLDTGARYFTKLELRSGYFQIRIAEGHKPNTTCVTRYNSYKFLVMPFYLTNAPATFCTLMNEIFHPYLDKFMVEYLDDIVIYTNTLKEHVEHLRFIKGYSARAAPLTNLLKNNKAWEWNERGQQTFEDLKKAVTKEPMLAIPDHTKVFEVEDNLLYTKGRRLYVPKWGSIRRNLIKECHDTKWVGHPGQRRTRALLKLAYYRHQIGDEVEAYPSTDCTADEMARLFFKHVVKYWGLPKHIISDRNPHFTRNFWTEIFKLMGLELNFSTSFHP
ncbi:RNA-directed DNA polymerase-like [Vitis vinifera]|uniref:RNA-directed DNA polymerase-like n=1 Tax=Vitis vinifera TaxID=29760 RepID=A0A438CAY5_VITVI|nr:RNA-directed DNA polymerase-like [Vitis vinifera]